MHRRLILGGLGLLAATNVLDERLGAPGAVPVSFAGTPAGGGWSNETIFLDVAASGGAKAQRLVMKMAPATRSWGTSESAEDSAVNNRVPSVSPSAWPSS